MSLSRSGLNGVRTSSRETAREKPKRRDRNFAACDNCRKAKARCGREGPGGTCQRPPTRRDRSGRRESPCTTPAELPDDTDSHTVSRKIKWDKGRKCRSCSRQKVRCDEWVPCSSCMRNGRKSEMPTRAARWPSKRRTLSIDAPSTLPPESLPSLLESPHPSLPSVAPVFSGNAADDVRVSSSSSSWAQSAGLQQQMALNWGNRQEPDPRSVQSQAVEPYRLSDIRQEVFGFENYPSNNIGEITSTLSGSQQSVLPGQPPDQAWFVPGISQSPFLEYYPPPQPQPQMYQQQTYVQQMHDRQVYQQQQVPSLSTDIIGEMPIEEEIYSYYPVE